MKRLVCIIPQVRCPDLTWPSFKTNVLDHLEADLLLCVRDSDEINEYTKNAKYIFKKNEDVDDWSKLFDEMSTEWRHFAHIPDGWLGPAKKPFKHNYTGGIVLFYRWYLYTILKSNGLLEEYDQIIVTRSDYTWVHPHPILDNDHVWFPNGEFHGGLCDRHMVVPSRLAEKFLSTGSTISMSQYEPMVRFYNTRSVYWMYNIESYLFFRYSLDGLLDLIGFFPQKMYLVTEDSGDVKYPGEYEDCQINSELVTWPWHIDFSIMRHGMFTGKAFCIPSSSDVSSNGGLAPPETR